MRHWLKLIGLFLIGFTLTAQDDTNFLDPAKTKYKYQYPSVKVNIGTLANTLNGGFGLSLDYPLARRWFVEVELGPILYGQYLKYRNERHLGFRTQGSLKFFINGANNEDTFRYIKGVFKYNRVKSRRYFTTFSLDGNYTQDQLVEGDFETYGPSFHIGTLELLGNERFFVDYSIGGGLVFWNYPLEIPGEFEIMEGNSPLFEANTSGGFFDLAIIFKIGMFLGKR